jgi:hypothetical protein
MIFSEKTIRFWATFFIGAIPLAAKSFVLFAVIQDTVPPISAQDVLFFCLVLCLSMIQEVVASDDVPTQWRLFTGFVSGCMAFGCGFFISLSFLPSSVNQTYVLAGSITLTLPTMLGYIYAFLLHSEQNRGDTV